MKELHLSIPKLALIGATRGALGVGVGLLMSSKLDAKHRKLIGLALLGVGALSTIPIALGIMHSRRSDEEQTPVHE